MAMMWYPSRVCPWTPFLQSLYVPLESDASWFIQVSHSYLSISPNDSSSFNMLCISLEQNSNWMNQNFLWLNHNKMEVVVFGYREKKRIAVRKHLQ